MCKIFIFCNSCNIGKLLIYHQRLKRCNRGTEARHKPHHKPIQKPIKMQNRLIIIHKQSSKFIISQSFAYSYFLSLILSVQTSKRKISKVTNKLLFQLVEKQTIPKVCNFLMFQWIMGYSQNVSIRSFMFCWPTPKAK